MSRVPIPDLALCSPTHHKRQTALKDGCSLMDGALVAAVGRELAHF